MLSHSHLWSSAIFDRAQGSLRVPYWYNTTGLLEPCTTFRSSRTFFVDLAESEPDTKSVDQLEACCGTLEPIRAVSKARLAGKTEKRQTLTCSTFVCWRNASLLESVISRSCRTFPPAPVQRTARSRPHDQLLLSKLFKIIFCRFRQTLSNEPVIIEVGITQSQIILTARLRKGS